MDNPPFSSLFVAAHLSRDEVERLYQGALKKIEISVFSYRLDLVTEIKEETLRAYQDLLKQQSAIQADYQNWLASVPDG